MTTPNEHPSGDPSNGPGSRNGSHTRSSWSSYEYPSTAIVETVAEAAGCEPTALPSLHGAVDTDALDAILAMRSQQRAVQVTVRYAGYTVTVSSDGPIAVADAANRR